MKLDYHFAYLPKCEWRIAEAYILVCYALGLTSNHTAAVEYEGSLRNHIRAISPFISRLLFRAAAKIKTMEYYLIIYHLLSGHKIKTDPIKYSNQEIEDLETVIQSAVKGEISYWGFIVDGNKIYLGQNVLINSTITICRAGA
jgi:hypothetical protein